MNGTHSHLLHQCRQHENCLRESLSTVRRRHVSHYVCWFCRFLSVQQKTERHEILMSERRAIENFRLAKFILLNQLNSRWLKSTYIRMHIKRIKRRTFHFNLSHFLLFLLPHRPHLGSNTQRVRFQTNEDSAAHKIEMDPIATVSTRPLYAKQNQAYAVELLVPPTPPTDDTSSEICKVHYFLAV